MTYCRPPPMRRTKMHGHPHRIQPRPSAARHNVDILSFLEQASLDLNDTEAGCILVALANQCEVDPAIMSAVKSMEVPDLDVEGDAIRANGSLISESTESTESLSETDRESKRSSSRIQHPETGRDGNSSQDRRKASAATEPSRFHGRVHADLNHYNRSPSPGSPVPISASDKSGNTSTRSSSGAPVAAAEAKPTARAAPAAAALIHTSGYSPRNDPILLLAEAAKVIHEEEKRNSWKSTNNRARNHQPHYDPANSDWYETDHYGTGYKRKPGNHSPVMAHADAKFQYSSDQHIPLSRGQDEASAADTFSRQYLSMKHDPKVKRNAMHAYITYMIYTDAVQSRTNIRRRSADEGYLSPAPTPYENDAPPAAMLAVNAGGDSMQHPPPFAAPDMDWNRPSRQDRSSLLSYGNKSYSPISLESSIITKPLTAFLHMDGPDRSKFTLPPLH